MFLASTKAVFPRLSKQSSSSSSSPFVPSHYLSLLDRCTTLTQVKQIQAPLTTSGLHSNPFLLGKLVEVLTIRLQDQHQALPHALLLFSHSNQPPNLFTWNTLIRALSLSPAPRHALHLFAEMLQTPDAAPDTYSFAFALKACARLQAHEATKSLHGLVVVSGWRSSNHAANTLMHAYASCGDVAAMRKLFDEVPSRDIVAWNVMLSGCVQNCLPSDALNLLQKMSSASVAPTDVTMITALSACSQMKDLLLGRQIHGCVCKRTMQFEKEINLGTSLIDMYAKCGCLEPAEEVFDEMRAKDVGVWNALLGGYVHNGCFIKALQFFEQLQESGLTPDGPTLVSALSACGNAGMLDAGKSIHAYMEGRYPCFGAVLGTALIEMYSKCGCIEGSREVFDKMPKKDAIAWSSMIRCLAVHGHSKDALELLALMRRSGKKPDTVTFVAVLCACSHAGLVEEGLSYFKSMIKDFGIVPRVEHYGCMIDLLSRAGRLREALELISWIDGKANAIIWRSLLSACRMNLDVEVAEIAVDNLTKLRSEHCGDYVLLSNIYAAKGMWDDARRMRNKMKESHISKKPAFSLIDSGNQIGIKYA
ncbi:pentatricopeptide repeat-containing protein [Canna indica]|uniref:Pentatricopeptide repeat-containing protein n=1 Tax=Canna indica TaxID=4628 RepID=A0AAQ3JNX6_9LILI|nr:pentatricopeptide repeat-containing protein [Canna indica]